MKTTEKKSISANTLESFVNLNISSKMFEMAYSADRDMLTSFMFDKNNTEFKALEMLNKFQSTSIKTKVLRNFEIAESLNIERMKHTKPITGDVLIDDLNNKYYLAEVYENHFQYVKNGSFWMGSSGRGSFSGGYEFNGVKNGKEIGSFKINDLEEVKDQKEFRIFWFFMDNSWGAHRGIYFYSNVRVWKFKTN